MRGNLCKIALFYCCLLKLLSYPNSLLAKEQDSPNIGAVYQTKAGRFYISIRTRLGAERFVGAKSSDGTIQLHLGGWSRRASKANTRKPLAASLSAHKGSIFFVSSRKSEAVSVRFSYEPASGRISSKSVHVSRVRAHSKLPCGIGTSNPIDSQVFPASSERGFSNQSVVTLSAGWPPTGPLFYPKREIELGVFSDRAFSKKQLNRADEYIEATINAANVLYLAQIGLKIKTVFSKVSTAVPSRQSDDMAESLLERFRRQGPSSWPKADLYHLFTGHYFLDNTIGLAYVGSTCIEGGAYAVGLSRSVSDALQPIVLAHEVSHGLGARHDSEQDSIMNTGLANRNYIFSPQARKNIGSFISKEALCIRPQFVPDIELDIELDSARFAANIKLDGGASSKCQVALQVSSAQKSKSTKWTTIASASLLDTPRQPDLITLATIAPTIGSRTALSAIPFRARISCGGRHSISSIKVVTPTRISSITTEEPKGSSWVDELMSNFRSTATN